MTINIGESRECGVCGEVKLLIAFATYKNPAGERRRRGVCKRCRDDGVDANSEALKQYRRDYKIDLIKLEIEKCDVVCACCHRLRTAARKENVSAPVSFRDAPTEDEPQRVVRPKRARGDLIAGSRCHLAKLAEAQVIEIRRRAAAGSRPVVLAQEFGVSKYTIYKVLSRTTWTRVEGGVAASDAPGAYTKTRASERLTVLA